MAPRAQRPSRMAAYGVTESPDGLLPWSWAEQRLVSSRNYWVTTVDPAGRPHSMPVWGVWIAADECFWFGCDPTSLKARNLATNAAIVVAADDSVEVVSVEGTAAQEPAPQAVADAWGAKYEPDDPAKAAELAGFFKEGTAFKVTPRAAFSLIERPEEFGSSATRWSW